MALNHTVVVDRDRDRDRDTFGIDIDVTEWSLALLNARYGARLHRYVMRWTQEKHSLARRSMITSDFERVCDQRGGIGFTHRHVCV